uniref:Uncharacterized protein n=1 Tax=Triticum urartu TaxID=4572 RepID=A0A8R7V2N9_TRIUA
MRREAEGKADNKQRQGTVRATAEEVAVLHNLQRAGTQVYNLPTARRFAKGSKEIEKMHKLWGGWTSALYLRH